MPWTLISDDQLAEIERRIVAHVVEEFGVDLAGLVLDMTNFATYIDSGNDRAAIAQRGHAKQKRNDLRLVGLGLVVSIDGGIPLVSHAYPGDKPDVTQFPELVSELVARFETLAGTRPPISPWSSTPARTPQDNYELVDGSPLHFVGSLPPSDHPDLLAVPKSRYRVVDAERFPGLRAFETRKVVFGAERRIVVTYSQNLHDKQSRGFDQTLAKARRQLGRTGRPPEPGQDPQTQGQGGGRDRHHPQAPLAHTGHLHHPFTASEPAQLRLTWRTKPQARADLEEEFFGKRILFTDKDPDLASTAADRGRLPLPRSRRGRLPPDERPPGGVLLAHVPLDRPQDPGPRLVPACWP